MIFFFNQNFGLIKKRHVNTGFIVIKCNSKTLSLWEKIIEFDLKQYAGEQNIINKLLLEKTIDLKWDLLPNEFYARSHYVFPHKIIMHHANCTVAPNSIKKKLIQIKIVRIKRILVMIDNISGNIGYKTLRLLRKIKSRFNRKPNIEG